MLGPRHVTQTGDGRNFTSSRNELEDLFNMLTAICLHMNDQAPGPPSSMLLQKSFVLLAKFLLVNGPPSGTSSPGSYNIELGGGGGLHLK